MTEEMTQGMGMIHDTELEKMVLVSLMVSGLDHSEAFDILDAECFMDPDNREIFVAIKALYSRGEMPDMVLVGNELAKTGSRVERKKVTLMCGETATVFDLREHVLTLKEYSLRRKLWEIGYRLMSRSSIMAEPLPVLHTEAKKGLDSLYGQMGDELITMADTYRSLQEDMLVRNSNPEIFPGTRTGFAKIDENGGLNGSDLIVVGAETSQGKTSFATALAMKAIENGEPVAFYSMEMTPKQLTARIASMRSGISSSHIQYHSMTMDEILRVDDAMAEIDCTLMHFDGESTSSLDKILMSIRNMKHKHGIKGAVVDYLQLISLGEKGASTEQTAARCARDLKNLAKELDIWIIAISQLSRNQQNPEPSLSRLRNSGQIEEAADNIFLIYRPKKGFKYPEPFPHISTEGTAMVSIAKGRHVGASEFICGFKGENTLFYPLDNNILPDAPQKPGIDNDLPF